MSGMGWEYLFFANRLVQAVLTFEYGAQKSECTLGIMSSDFSREGGYIRLLVPFGQALAFY